MNKTYVLAAFLAALTPSLAAAETQGTAPGMFDVREVVVQYANFGDPKSADACGLGREEIAARLVKAMTENGVPATLVANAKPPSIGVARIEAITEITTFNNQGLDCTSWVSLAVQSRASVHIPPVEVSRNVTIMYWRDGLMLASSQSTHSRTVEEALDKLAKKFAQQYRLDQPPPLPAQ